MPIFFLSGALFPMNSLPPALKIIIQVNPLSYGVDGLRSVLTNAGSLGLFADFSVLIILTLVIMAIGSYLFSKIEA
jgi:ABC-2 type transport system permease protein